MGIADDGLTLPVVDTSTDDGKNTHASNVVKHVISNRLIRDCARAVNDANEAISLAPGDKAAVLSKLGTDQAEVEAVMDALLAIYNSRRKTGDAAKLFDGTYP